MVDLAKYGRGLKRGAILTLAPELLKGALLEFFREKGVDTRVITQWVLDNYSLWDAFDPERQRQFRHLAAKVGSVKWITVDWVVESVRADYSAVASLFLPGGWKKARSWLIRQTEIIRQELKP